MSAMAIALGLTEPLVVLVLAEGRVKSELEVTVNVRMGKVAELDGMRPGTELVVVAEGGTTIRVVEVTDVVEPDESWVVVGLVVSVPVPLLFEEEVILPGKLKGVVVKVDGIAVKSKEIEKSSNSDRFVDRPAYNVWSLSYSSSVWYQWNLE
jgi:hypothetical protein